MVEDLNSLMSEAKQQKPWYTVSGSDSSGEE